MSIRVHSAVAVRAVPLGLAAVLALFATAAPLEAQDGPSATIGEEAETNTMADDAADAALNPAQQARMRVSAANRSIAQGEKLEAKAADAKDEKKRNELRDKAKKSFESAIGDYQAALRLDPKLAEAYVGLATLMVRSGRIDQALATVEQALQIEPGSVDALMAKGRAQLAGFKVNDAKATYDRLAADSAKNAKKYLGEMRSWLDATRAKLGPEMAEAVAELDRWIGEREAK